MGTLGALIASVWALSPGIRPVVAQMPVPAGDRALAALSAQAITPLALGADTGRRMGATDAVRPLANRPERPRVELTATLGRSDSFARVLERAGVGGTEAAEAARLVAGATALDAIKPGTRMDLVLGRRPSQSVPRPLERLFFRADLGLALAVQRAGTGLEIVPTRIPVDATPAARQRHGGRQPLSLRACRRGCRPTRCRRRSWRSEGVSAGSTACPPPRASIWWSSSGARRPARWSSAGCCWPACGATGDRRT